MQLVKNMTQLELCALPVPTLTDSYTPVPHQEIFDTIETALDKAGLIVDKTTFMGARDGKQLIGFYDLEPNDEGLVHRIGLKNSYDKSMSLGFVSGVGAWICGNSCLFGDHTLSRIHTGKADVVLFNYINEVIESLPIEMAAAKLLKQDLSSKQVSRKASAQLLGELVVTEDIINTVQLNIIRGELENPSFNYGAEGSLWELYNYCTFAMKGTHPLQYFQKHKELENFFHFTE
jgi:hypothetical protein